MHAAALLLHALMTVFSPSQNLNTTKKNGILQVGHTIRDSESVHFKICTNIHVDARRSAESPLVTVVLSTGINF
jgi:hypothetical protein